MIFEEVCKFFVNNAIAILILPLWVMLMIWLNSAMTFVDSKKLTFNLSILMSLIGIIFSASCVWYCLHNPQTIVEWNAVWLQVHDIQVSFGTFVDNISSALMLFTSFILLLLEIYAYGNLKDEKNFHKFFLLFNFLKFALFALITSSNLIQTYMFWELVGIGLYMLVGFWQGRKNSTDAAKKMFLSAKVGSVAFLGGIIVLIYFSVIFSAPHNVVLLSFSDLQFTAEILYSMVSTLTFFVVTLLFVVAILIKMAQFPFHSWLSTSIETLTPVNAVLQGVLPVACGGLLLMRLYPLFILSDYMMKFFCIIGAISAVMFSYVAISQNNIKKLIAYLTSSQLGFGLIGVGVGAFSWSALYMIESGLARVLLIMIVGSVIVAMNNENDIKYFGGLKKRLPLLAIIFIITSISLVGFLIGTFCSVSMILTGVINLNNMLLLCACLLFVFMITFALFRAYCLIFEGEESYNFQLQSIPKRLYLAIIILLFVMLYSGYVLKDKFSDFIYFITPDKYYFNVALTVIVLSIILFAIYIAFTLYALHYNKFIVIKEHILAKESFIYKFSYKAFYFDEICSWVNEKILLRFCGFLDFIDKYIIRVLVGLVSLSARFFSYVVTKFQNGNLQTYIFYTVSLISLVLFSMAVICIIGSLMGV